MAIDRNPWEDNPLTFSLVDKNPRSDLRLVIMVPSEDMRENWVTKISAMVEMQRDFLHG